MTSRAVESVASVQQALFDMTSFPVSRCWSVADTRHIACMNIRTSRGIEVEACVDRGSRWWRAGALTGLTLITIQAATLSLLYLR